MYWNNEKRSKTLHHVVNGFLNHSDDDIPVFNFYEKQLKLFTAMTFNRQYLAIDKLNKSLSAELVLKFVSFFYCNLLLLDVYLIICYHIQFEVYFVT